MVFRMNENGTTSKIMWHNVPTKPLTLLSSRFAGACSMLNHTKPISFQT